MPDPVTGIIGGTTLVGGVLQSRSASRATRAQQQAADQSIAEQRRQFDAMQALLRPYVDAGGPALRGLMDLAGLSPVQTNWRGFAEANPELMAAFRAQQAVPAPRGPTPYSPGDSPGFSYNPAAMGMDFALGPNQVGRGGMTRGGAELTSYNMTGQNFANMTGGGAPMSLEQFAENWYRQNGGDISAFQDNPQARAVAQIEGQPMFQALARQGEDAILQSASATGGLRGGNTQGALARFRPELLNQFINQQYARLAGITEMGQNAAAGVGSAGLATGANIGNILSNRGVATAAGAGAQGQIWGNAIGGLGGLLAGSINPLRGLQGDVRSMMNQNPGLF